MSNGNEGNRQEFQTHRSEDLVAKLDGEFVVFTTDGSPDTQEDVPHGLGRKPRGFFVVGSDKAGSIYDGGTANTDTTLSIKASIATMAIRLYVF